jgi:hypothetical protein
MGPSKQIAKASALLHGPSYGGACRERIRVACNGARRVPGVNVVRPAGRSTLAALMRLVSHPVKEWPGSSGWWSTSRVPEK